MLMLSNFSISHDFRKAFMGSMGTTMSKKFADAIIEKAAHMIDNEASCSKHHDQNLVMFESDKEFFGC